MIISRTPFRISFAGGGTDLPDYYREAGGCVTSSAIDKYMFITVHPPFDERIRLKYSQTELVEDVDAVEHPIIREALKLTGIKGRIEISAAADIPEQAGLGSSSSFAVGLLHALHAFKGEQVNAETLAREACEIELERLGDPIGKQDQYIAAYGGLQHIAFNPDDTVSVDPVIMPGARRAEFERHLMLFHCGGARSARDLLKTQRANIPSRMKQLGRLGELARQLREVLARDGDLLLAGEILHEGWCLKRTLSDAITTLDIDAWYEKAREAGALGGKLLGAGGGGFLLLFVAPGKQEAVEKALSELRLVPIGLEREGSKIVYYA